MLPTRELDGAAPRAGAGDMFVPADGDGAALAVDAVHAVGAAGAVGAGLSLGSGLDVAFPRARPAPGVQAAPVAAPVTATRPIPAGAAPRRNPRRVTAASVSPAGPPASAMGLDVASESCGVTVSMGRHGTRPERGIDGTFVTIGRV
jgi:hypothetical protein